MAGQIIKRGDNKWLVRVFLGREEESGKRRYYNKTIRGTKKDAQRFINGVLRQLDLGEFIEPSAITVADYFEKWLESIGSRVREKSVLGYRYLTKNHILPAIGNRRLSSLQVWDIQHLYGEMERSGASAVLISHVHTVISSAMRQAVRWRMIKQNPAGLAELPKGKRGELRAMSQAQVVKFLKAAESDEMYALFAVAISGGMRPSEYLGLTWADVDLSKGIVQVRRTLQRRVGGGWYFGDTKTTGSRRQVPLPFSTVQLLDEHRRRQLAERLRLGTGYENHDLVFAKQTGRPYELADVRRRFHAVLKRAKLPRFRVYDMRHTCATLLLATGENPKVVAERLGHSSVTTTLNVYSHVLPTLQQGAAEKLESAIFGKLAH